MRFVVNDVVNNWFCEEDRDIEIKLLEIFGWSNYYYVSHHFFYNDYTGKIFVALSSNEATFCQVIFKIYYAYKIFIGT